MEWSCWSLTDTRPLGDAPPGLSKGVWPGLQKRKQLNTGYANSGWASLSVYQQRVPTQNPPALQWKSNDNRCNKGPVWYAQPRGAATAGYSACIHLWDGFSGLLKAFIHMGWWRYEFALRTLAWRGGVGGGVTRWWGHCCLSPLKLFFFFMFNQSTIILKTWLYYMHVLYWAVLSLQGILCTHTDPTHR